MQDCNKAIELKPRLCEPRRIRGYALYKMGKYKESIDDCCAAINLSNEDIYAKAVSVVDC